MPTDLQFGSSGPRPAIMLARRLQSALHVCCRRAGRMHIRNWANRRGAGVGVFILLIGVWCIWYAMRRAKRKVIWGFVGGVLAVAGIMLMMNM